jgi:hypothetical protein
LPPQGHCSLCLEGAASRDAFRLRGIVSHDRPDWNASSVVRSNRPRSSVTGRPHSSSW